MSTSFSFTNFTGFSSPIKKSGEEKAVSERQYKFYTDLCEQRKIEPKSIKDFASFDELDEEIKRIRLSFPASENQIKLIKAKINNLNKMGVNIVMPDVNSLTGGRNGTASKLIESLIKMENQYRDQMPPSEAQLQYIVSMFLCPDVGFEEHNINKKVNLEDGKWRYMTPDEFAEEVKSKLNKKKASKFIDKYKDAFNQWRLTRIRPEQQRYIRILEDRIAGKETPAEIKWIVNDKGEIEMQKIYDTSEDNTKIWRLTEMQLMQLSIDDASKYIEILTSELSRKEESFSEETSQIEKEKAKEDFEALQELLYRLEAVAGYEVPELHELVTSLITEGFNSEEITRVKEEIHNFMVSLIEQDAIDLPELVELCKDSPTAQRILLNVA
ncbi:MAG TPA: hypothetical protein GX708_05200 [Gallicola sp.]|nr:hypothetical protein [Gallicola sp.]